MSRGNRGGFGARSNPPNRGGFGARPKPPMSREKDPRPVELKLPHSYDPKLRQQVLDLPLEVREDPDLIAASNTESNIPGGLMKFWQNFMKDGRGLKLFHEGQKRDRQASLSEQPFQKVEPKKRNKPHLEGLKASSQKRASNLQDRSAPLQKKTRKDDRVADELL